MLPYFFRSDERVGFYGKRNVEIRDSHVIKLMANDRKEWISLFSCEPSLIAVIFIFLCYFVLFCYVFVFVLFFNIQS